ncbi:hypothetical protein N7447_003930, partial [Penicillium robsamsonii]|uniref:uncharacterized protein n=1 Tax=Penicillium robsamsonii TaxID=1792511 RepID=UPI002546A83A
MEGNSQAYTNSRYPTPGLDAATWVSVLEEFKSVLGDEVVLTGHEHRLRYNDPYSEGSDEQGKRGSSATLFPVTVEHIQAVLKICNKHKIPLWTVSRGKNLGYGGPAARGSIILDLQCMRKVIEINDRYSYYTVERGVTFCDIYQEIQEQKKNIWCSVPALGWGSVVGNALDRGWDGSVVRTGAGAIDKSPCWPLFRGGYGPTYESMFSQSNFGIVTKLTLWASPSPEGFMACRIDVENEEDLSPLIDGFRDLLLRDVIQNHPLIENIPREIIKRGQRQDFYDGEGTIPDAQLKEIQKQLGIGFWSARFGLYGPKEMIEYNWKRCQKVFDKLPGAKLTGKAYYPPVEKEILSPKDIPLPERSVETGTPNLMALKAVEYRGKDGGHISFSPVLPPEGSCAMAFYRDVKPLCAHHGFDYFSGLHLYPRHLTMINMIYFDRTSDNERANANKLFVDLVNLARKHGYSEYRAHIDLLPI